jgi:oxygen-dependent protoporphyrinogen oxidase
MHDLVILGGGISGLALAHFAGREGISDVVVLEARTRAGGKVQTEWSDGYCCEWGPQGFLDNVPETLELADQLGLSGALVRADDAAGDRFIMRGGRLRRLPLSPPAFLCSDVLSLRGRLRVLLEPFPGRGPEDDESVFQFASRRIGREAAEVLVDAMVTGVYAGDPARLSLSATFPKMREMERRHGSLVKAMIARRRAGGSGGPAGPGGALTTFRLGMQQLTDALASGLGSRLRLGADVGAIARHPDAFSIELEDGERVQARRVAVALPPQVAASVLQPLLAPAALAGLTEIPAVRIAVVMTGYRSSSPFARPARGFGFLVAGRERRQILGTIYCSSTFPGQAPPAHTLLRTLLGGARNGEILDRSDDELLAVVRRELDLALGGDPAPDFVRVVRHEYGIPQYTLGHPTRLRRIAEAVRQVPGLVVLGNGYRGVAVNACVAEARSVAATLAGRRASPAGAAGTSGRGLTAAPPNR